MDPVSFVELTKYQENWLPWFALTPQYSFPQLRTHHGRQTIATSRSHSVSHRLEEEAPEAYPFLAKRSFLRACLLHFCLGQPTGTWWVCLEIRNCSSSDYVNFLNKFTRTKKWRSKSTKYQDCWGVPLLVLFYEHAKLTHCVWQMGTNLLINLQQYAIMWWNIFPLD